MSAKNITASPLRLQVLRWAMIVLAAVVIGRLFYLQIIRHSFFAGLAAQQHEVQRVLAAERGDIYAQDTRQPFTSTKELSPIATNQQFYVVYAQTYAVVDPVQTAADLNSVLDLPADVMSRIEQQLAKLDDPYEPLVHRVTQAKIDQLSVLALPGIHWEPEQQRYYPMGVLGSNALGFVGWVGDELLGQYGIEGYWQKELAGENGFARTERDAAGRPIGVGERIVDQPVHGDDIVLTLDRNLQEVACRALDQAVTKYDADSGAVVIMQPKTGAILALCSNPDFDPNAYNQVPNAKVYINRATFDPYEPGSVFKAITMAAAIDQGKVTPATTYEDTGAVVIGPHTIRNFDEAAHGVQTMVGVLEQSLNTGAIFAMRQIGADIFREYVDKFDFGQMPGVTISSEAAGDISSLKLKDGGEIYAATASFGQGITTTPIQLAAAYAAIANGGILMRPYIIDRIITPEGKATITKPERIRRVIEERTARMVSGMLVQVIQAGHSKKSGIPGYYLAGKTGTAQVASAGGYGNQFIHTFIGFGPATDPQFVILVRLDHPTAARFADGTAGPVFRELAQFIINYYHIKPDAGD